MLFRAADTEYIDFRHLAESFVDFLAAGAAVVDYTSFLLCERRETVTIVA
jgi:hypothetical protein